MIADLRQYTHALPPVAKGPNHAFSSNGGLDWTVNSDEGAIASGVTAAHITRRERPHILMNTPHESDESVAIALFNGASATNTHERGHDHTFTLVQPFVEMG